MYVHIHVYVRLTEKNVSEVKVRVKSQFETRSVGPRSSIKDSFLVLFYVH